MRRSRYTDVKKCHKSPDGEMIIQAPFYSQYIKLTIVHIYAPTEEADEQVKEEFYIRLQDLPDNRNKHDLLIVTGDMNAKGGEENWGYDNEMARMGWDSERLCQFCDMNELVVTGTLLPHRNIDKATWISPNRITMISDRSRIN